MQQKTQGDLLFQFPEEETLRQEFSAVNFGGDSARKTLLCTGGVRANRNR